MSGIDEGDIEAVSLGIIVGVGILLWIVIRLALHDRKRHDDARKDADKKKEDA